MIKVTVKTGKRDKFGDRINSGDVVVYALGFSPVSSVLNTEEHNQQTDRTGTLFVKGNLPDGIGPNTQFVFAEYIGGQDKTWTIDGDINRWSWPWGGWKPGYEIPVRRVTG
jgi:hypothetical protein